MPGVSGGPDGKLSITFCTVGGGIGTLALGLDDPADPSSPDGHTNSPDCPFGVVVSQAVMPGQPASTSLGLLAPQAQPFAQHHEARPPRPALGTPLGSRAPPSTLA